jgi:hypothetical protein
MRARLRDNPQAFERREQNRSDAGGGVNPQNAYMACE